MSKEVAIVYWSGTGNTEAIANLVAEGVASAGGNAARFSSAEFDTAKSASYSAIALGYPAMGTECWRKSNSSLCMTASGAL